MTIIGILILIYFVKKQYSFERPKRFTYLLIPIYSLVMFCTTFPINAQNIYFAFGILVIGIAIGIFQGNSAEIKSYIGESGESRVKIKGGNNYLLGWLAIIAVQILIEILLVHHNIDTGEIVKEIQGSIKEEIMPLSRIHRGGFWALWILTGSASLFYTIVLSKRSPEFRQTIKRGSRKKDRMPQKKELTSLVSSFYNHQD